MPFPHKIIISVLENYRKKQNKLKQQHVSTLENKQNLPHKFIYDGIQALHAE